MAPPLPISGARQIAGFAIAVGDHDVAEDAEQGEIGGLIAFGLICIFVGPVILAVAEKLLMAWIEGDIQQARTPDAQ